ncbi:WXG100 family type VII secretion target [Actinospica sp. MGRD01-02]|uniref:WXG100 family type VII secretion target n=1 Tax=Actinospica acidithermotolerans TaxID=2828514 RepID=A0A941EDC0_9ACTN|nr:WXG100 family type VII secretion target [Actinospica acidithermotolerans]MBR7828548.1 WXG100 family type VII secretion target [Actinospica acidithermotolerans]
MLIGADPDQLDALASQMDSDAQTLDQIRGRVGGVLEQLLWQGADAHDFFEIWAQRFSGMVGNAAAGLQDAARCLRAEAVQQREASGEGGGFNILDPISFGISAGAEGLHALKLANVSVVADELKDLGLTDKGFEVLDSLESVALPLEVVGLAVNFTNLAVDWSADPGSAETLKAGVDTGLSLGSVGVGVAEVALVAAGVEVAPVIVGAGIAFGVAELTNDVASYFDPQLDEQVLHGAEAGARVVASGVRDAFSLLRHNPLNWVPAL